MQVMVMPQVMARKLIQRLGLNLLRSMLLGISKKQYVAKKTREAVLYCSELRPSSFSRPLSLATPILMRSGGRGEAEASQ
jgi:hypothetical protein